MVIGSIRAVAARFRAWKRSAKTAGPGRWKLCWKPARWDCGSHPDLPADAKVSVWLHEVVVSETLTPWLASTVEGTGAELAALYKARQDVETDIRDVKRTQRMDELRGQSAAAVGKECRRAWWPIICWSRCGDWRRLGRAGVAPRRLSFAGVWSLVKVTRLSGPARSPEEWSEALDRVIRAAGQRKVPKRPGRKYPRTVIRRGPKYPDRLPRSIQSKCHWVANRPHTTTIDLVAGA